jgi:hypothetical protein
MINKLFPHIYLFLFIFINIIIYVNLLIGNELSLTQNYIIIIIIKTGMLLIHGQELIFNEFI